MIIKNVDRRNKFYGTRYTKIMRYKTSEWYGTCNGYDKLTEANISWKIYHKTHNDNHYKWTFKSDVLIRFNHDLGHADLYVTEENILKIAIILS